MLVDEVRRARRIKDLLNQYQNDMPNDMPDDIPDRAPPNQLTEESMSRYDAIDMLQAELEALAATLRSPATSSDSSKDPPSTNKQ